MADDKRKVPKEAQQCTLKATFQTKPKKHPIASIRYGLFKSDEQQSSMCSMPAITESEASLIPGTEENEPSP
ncbi:hypothetical protein T01_12828 [Trichinella spiralis]|uniref:Uncharacterized protein n=1 Tax=Trichinella spiralis TaxID=6334 RepID=A0A0V1BW45_TRISP|nr:hypothetical protein T01_12828 [Trichinella spiralis]